VSHRDARARCRDICVRSRSCGRGRLFPDSRLRLIIVEGAKLVERVFAVSAGKCDAFHVDILLRLLLAESAYAETMRTGGRQTPQMVGEDEAVRKFPSDHDQLNWLINHACGLLEPHAQRGRR
jgi:hypothetical protein